MRRLIVITGITGSGKSRLAESLYNKIDDSLLLSMDTIKEFVSDAVPFKNRSEKFRNRDISRELFKTLLKELMVRQNETIIIEYPFRREWQSLLETLCVSYDYRLIIVKVRVKDFEDYYSRLVQRDSSDSRHASHGSSKYNVREVVKNRCSIAREEIEEDYNNGIFEDIYGNKQYEFINDYTTEGMDKIVDSIVKDMENRVI